MLGFPGEESWWYRKSERQDGPWTQHVALDVTDNESPTFTDLTGDGKPEIVCMSKGFIGYAESDPKNPRRKIQWHSISPLRHGARQGWQEATSISASRTASASAT